MLLKNKLALITGSTRGIGKTIAEVFAKNGANLILNARDKIKSEAFATELRNKYNIEVFVVLFDVSNYDEVKQGFK